MHLLHLQSLPHQNYAPNTAHITTHKHHSLQTPRHTDTTAYKHYLFSVYLCLTSIAISNTLPLSCQGMCSLSLTAICYYCSLPTPATALIGPTCTEHVLLAIRMQLSAINCSSRTTTLHASASLNKCTYRLTSFRRSISSL